MLEGLCDDREKKKDILQMNLRFVWTPQRFIVSLIVLESVDGANIWGNDI